MMIKQMARLWICALLVAGALYGQAQSQTQNGRPIPLDATLDPDGRALELVWQDASPLRARDITVSRRVLGTTGADTWDALEVLAGRFIKTRDETITPGIAYEYRVLRNHGDFFSAGYWATGTDVPAPQDHGTVFVVVDETLFEALQRRLTRLEDDLIGAGWQVRWLKTPRNLPGNPVETLARARALRGQLQAGVAAQPAGLRHAVLLVGHVPLVLSGRVAPDGHGAVPHASDLFYGDLTGVWPDNGAGLLLPSRLPAGGIDMAVGRVDFATVAGGDAAFEITHLRAYLDKAHHWRHGLLNTPRAAYGQSKHLQVEQFDLRNIVGPEAIAKSGHHDAGEAQPWLWGVDFGKADGRKYPDYTLKPVFAINFGSHKQKIHRPNNALVGTLAQPFYTVAVAWGGRPAWRLHQMGMGRTIGQAQMITVNNGRAAARYPDDMDYVPTGAYPWRAPIWANLLGDPTLHAFPLGAPRAFRAHRNAAGHVVLDWEGDTARTLLLRAPAGGAFTPLSGLSGVQRFVDDTPLPDARYQLRSLRKETVYAGSFHTASQGAFTRVGQAVPTAPDLRQDMTGPGPHRLNLDQTQTLLAPLRPPPVGRLKLQATGWHYVPADGFEGQVDIALTASGSGQTVVGRLRLSITQPPPPDVTDPGISEDTAD